MSFFTTIAPAIVVATAASSALTVTAPGEHTRKSVERGQLAKWLGWETEDIIKTGALSSVTGSGATTMVNLFEKGKDKRELSDDDVRHCRTAFAIAI
ncbi:hypothetical protein BC834DRAFT_968154 [Gloeopeniophorella convolvens]|nr:hypothetical protein BC834DRAFT_968154 [Gloeopeniophorella convolvens]